MTHANYSALVGRNPKPTPNERAAWVRHVREQVAHMSQDAFADAIGVERPTVSNWERGRYIPEWASIEKILKAFPAAPRPQFGQGRAVSDPGSTVPETTQNSGDYIVKTDQGRIIAKMIDAIEDEAQRTEAMLTCAAELKKHPSELGVDKRPDRAQRK